MTATIKCVPPLKILHKVGAPGQSFPMITPDRDTLDSPG